jgi:16S rRNA (adenine1518-N6/adenine1519-N6)-dimethyltransferase
VKRTKPRTAKATRGARRPVSSRHRPRKRFGQHFLAASWAKRVVDAVAPEPNDVFLEIGPGEGALTRPLAESGVPVLAVEIDRDLVAHLASAVPPSVTVLSGDILTSEVIPIITGLSPLRPPGSPGDSKPRRYRIAGNLPYNIASPVIGRMLDWQKQHQLFADATVMVQREMADRLVARPGSRDYGVLSILVSLRASVSRLFDLPPGAFSPPPKVKSSVIRLVFRPPQVRLPDELMFERMVKALFSQRRKTLANALKRFDATGLAVLALSGLDGRRRPETLQLAELAHLAEIFATVKRPAVL